MGFAAALAAMDDDRLAGLFDRRPDLTMYGNVWNFDQLADMASRWHSQASVLADLDECARRVFDLVLLAESPTTTEAVCEVSGGVLAAADAEPVLERLADLAVLWRDDAGQWHLPGQARAQLLYPAGLGRPFRRLAKTMVKDEIRAIADTLGLAEAAQPDARRNQKGVTKDQLVDAITATLADPQQMDDLVSSCPDHGLGQRFVDVVGARQPQIALPHRYVTSRYSGQYRSAPGHRDPHPTDWLEGRGLVVRTDYETGEIPREVGLALRGGRPFVDLRTEAPPLVPVPAGPPGTVGATASSAAQQLLDAVGTIVFDLAATPIAANKSGGVGVRALKAVAKSVDRTERETAQILELMTAADILGVEFGRTQTTVTTTDLADQWLAAPPAQRWLALVHAWLTTSSMVAAAGGRDAKDKPIAPVRGQVPGVTGIRQTRAQLLGALAPLPEDTAATPEGLYDHLRFLGPGQWGNTNPDLTGGGTLLDAVLSEAVLVGAVGAGGLSAPARALLDDDLPLAEKEAERFLPQTVDELLVQADLTVVAPGPIAPEVAAVLADMATVESRGGATTWRLSEASVRSALDAGHDSADLIALLDDRSVGGIPQPVRYLIDDVARRHGTLRVRAAGAVIRCEDEALLATVAGHRRLRSKVELVAPTVAVCTDEGETVLAALRDAGFLPMLEGAGGEVVVPSGSGVRAPVRSRPMGRRAPDDADDDDDDADDDLPWWARTSPTDELWRPRIAPAEVVSRLRARERSAGSSETGAAAAGGGRFGAGGSGGGRFGGVEPPVQEALAGLRAIQSARNAEPFDENRWRALPLLERLEQAMRHGIDIVVQLADARHDDIDGGVLFCDDDVVILDCIDCDETHTVGLDDIVTVELAQP